MPPETGVPWPRPIFEFLEFAMAFLAIGAIGWRRLVSAGVRRRPELASEERAALDRADARAAAIGLVGSLYGVYHVLESLPAQAARRHVTVGTLLATTPPASVWLGLALLATLGFALAAARRGPGWWLAAIGVVAGTLRAALFGQWERVIKPVHVLGGGLWLGTLFVLVVAGLAVALGRDVPAARRGPLAAAMVNAFSPAALVSAGLLGAFGGWLAWRELQPFASLWTTAYGFTLIAKLSAVAIVVGFGAWNWRRQKPRLGTEPAARSLARSATAELVIALAVIAITAILVTLPSPESLARGR